MTEAFSKFQAMISARGFCSLLLHLYASPTINIRGEAFFVLIKSYKWVFALVAFT